MPGLGRVTWLPDNTWMAEVTGDPEGRVRVFVGRDEAEAEAWYQARYDGLKPLPVAPFVPAQVVRGNGQSLVLMREGNVAAQVDSGVENAMGLATTLLGAMEPARPWPVAPALTFSDGELHLGGGPWAHVQWTVPLDLGPRGGAVDTGSVIPTGSESARIIGTVAHVDVTAWDRTGRVVHVRHEP